MWIYEMSKYAQICIIYDIGNAIKQPDRNSLFLPPTFSSFPGIFKNQMCQERRIVVSLERW